jgi:hypothetical protein
MLLDAAFKLDPKTRAYFIVPLKETTERTGTRNHWLKDILDNKNWRLVKWYGENTFVFKGPNDKQKLRNI